jgi:Na+/melibiose symporter-like transporter
MDLRMLQVLRIRDFRLLWGAGLVSSLGSWLLVIAIPAHVYLVSKSLAATGAVLAAQYLPLLLLTPAAGVIADRWDRRRLMLAADLFRAMAVSLLLLGIRPQTYWIVYVALAAESSGTVLFAPALRARVPAIVGTGPDLASAAALNALSDGAVRLVGGPLGGLLLTFAGITTLICADAGSYLVSAAGLFLTSRQAGLRNDAAGRMRGDLREGVRALRAQPTARALLPVSVLFLAANGSLSAVLMPFAIIRLGGPTRAAFLLIALGAGFLLGAPLIRALLLRLRPRALLPACQAVTAAGFLLLFRSSSLISAEPAAIVVGVAGSMTLAGFQATVQRVIADRLLGRVSAIFIAAEAAATLVGAVAGPALAQVAGLSGLAGIASLVTFASAALGFALLPAGPQPAVQGALSGAEERR